MGNSLHYVIGSILTLFSFHVCHSLDPLAGPKEAWCSLPSAKVQQRLTYCADRGNAYFCMDGFGVTSMLFRRAVRRTKLAIASFTYAAVHGKRKKYTPDVINTYS
ncbi:hypothetical protein EDC04DRAFT_2650224 [Pisolithus marmoratus]|nr:hypothetical protein EDC04DRAFT_2650224 [Pisolithus marmoratus]